MGFTVPLRIKNTPHLGLCYDNTLSEGLRRLRPSFPLILISRTVFPDPVKPPFRIKLLRARLKVESTSRRACCDTRESTDRGRDRSPKKPLNPHPRRNTFFNQWCSPHSTIKVASSLEGWAERRIDHPEAVTYGDEARKARVLEAALGNVTEDRRQSSDPPTKTGSLLAVGFGSPHARRRTFHVDPFFHSKFRSDRSSALKSPPHRPNMESI